MFSAKYEFDLPIIERFDFDICGFNQAISKGFQYEIQFYHSRLLLYASRLVLLFLE